MSDFEKYLQNNKKKLAEEPPGPELWLAIENEMLRQKNRQNRRYIRWMAAAATILFLIIAMSGWYFHWGQNQQQQLLAQYGLENPQLQQEIQLKKQVLAKAEIPFDKKEDFDLLLSQLQFLDAQYFDYLQYLEQNGYQEFIGQQILHYYKMKISLLDKIQSEIEKINDYEKQYQQTSKKVLLDI